MKKLIGLMIFVLIISLTGCFFGAGTHGSIRGYQYPTTKYELEKAVMTVIKNNKSIYRDTTKDSTSGKSDADFNNYYNDGKNYVTIKIKGADIEYEYTFRYYGGEEYWKTSTNSEIFICYVHDGKGNGGNAGDGSFDKTPPEIKRNMIKLFETKFVNKIDKELHLVHTDD
jgi:hypothetical protein